MISQVVISHSAERMQRGAITAAAQQKPAAILFTYIKTTSRPWAVFSLP